MLRPNFKVGDRVRVKLWDDMMFDDPNMQHWTWHTGTVIQVDPTPAFFSPMYRVMGEDGKEYRGGGDEDLEGLFE